MNIKQRSVRTAVRVGCLLAGAIVSSGSAMATAGFAEWEIYTPGGHLISHVDGSKEEHGDCLRSDPRGESGSSRVFVSHLKRWRYYDGYVVGENLDGFFIFDERAEQLQGFADEAAVNAMISRLDPGRPVSDWLTGAEGWREAWFPFYVWRPCREKLRSIISAEDCRKAMTPETMDLLRKTTWGRHCARARDRAPATPPDAFWTDFCEELGVPLLPGDSTP